MTPGAETRFSRDMTTRLTWGGLFDDREGGIFCDPFHLVEGGNEIVELSSHKA